MTLVVGGLIDGPLVTRGLAGVVAPFTPPPAWSYSTGTGEDDSLPGFSSSSRATD